MKNDHKEIKHGLKEKQNIWKETQNDIKRKI